MTNYEKKRELIDLIDELDFIRDDLRDVLKGGLDDRSRTDIEMILAKLDSNSAKITAYMRSVY